MKKKHGRKEQKTSAKKTARKVASTPASPAKGLISVSSVEVPPSPDDLFQDAVQEPDYHALRAYAGSIKVLRKKGFSYREISEWFSNRGVDADHNAVYRVYTNSLSDLDAHLESEREKEEALQEAMRNR